MCLLLIFISHVFPFWIATTTPQHLTIIIHHTCSKELSDLNYSQNFSLLFAHIHSIFSLHQIIWAIKMFLLCCANYVVSCFCCVVLILLHCSLFPLCCDFLCVVSCFRCVVLISLHCGLFPLCCDLFPLCCNLFLLCCGLFTLCWWLVYVVFATCFCCVMLIMLCCDLFLMCCAKYVVLRLVSVVLC